MARNGWKGRGAASRVADAIGANRQLVASWLRGERSPGGKYFGKLAKLFGQEALWPTGADAPRRRPGEPGASEERRSGVGAVGGRLVAESNDVVHYGRLSPEEVTREVVDAIAHQVGKLAAKGPRAVAMWLLSAASSANDQGINDVKPLIDLARRFLHVAEVQALAGRSDASELSSPHPPQ